MSSYLTVKDLPQEERPRERLLHYGAEHLSAQELLAIILGRGVAGHSILTIAQELLHKFGSLEGVVSASLQELQTIEGLGPAKTLQLKACLEVARRVITEEAGVEAERQKLQSVTQPEDIVRLVKPLIRNFQKEHFFAVSFDNRSRVSGVDLIGVGTLNTNLVHPRETFEVAISKSAASIAVAHNHPSGDPSPSQADIEVTQRLSEAGRILGIELIDHVIVTKTQYYSFKQQGLL